MIGVQKEELKDSTDPKRVFVTPGRINAFLLKEEIEEWPHLDEEVIEQVVFHRDGSVPIAYHRDGTGSMPFMSPFLGKDNLADLILTLEAIDYDESEDLVDDAAAWWKLDDDKCVVRGSDIFES